MSNPNPIHSGDLGPGALTAAERARESIQERRGHDATLVVYDRLVAITCSRATADRIIEELGGWLLPTSRSVRVAEARAQFFAGQMSLLGKAGAELLRVTDRTLRRWALKKMPGRTNPDNR